MRNATRFFPILGICAALAGCGGDEGHGPFIGSSVLPAGAPLARIAIGVGAEVAAGVPGYVVTANTGNVFRTVWTGSDGVHHFFGSIFAPGQFLLVAPGCGGACPLGPSDAISEPVAVSGGQRIDFDTVVDGGIVGVEFQIVESQPAFFDLFVDGDRRPDLVFFPSGSDPSQVVTAPGMPFGLIATGVVQGVLQAPPPPPAQ